MQVRLGFAVAAHLEPEILIVDEVLAVGDAAFQRKCIGKLGDVASEGRSVLVVSHNMAVVERLCTRGLLLNQGNVIAEGTATEVIRRYMSSTERPVDGDVALSDHEHRLPGMDTLLSRIRLLDKSGRISTEFAQGEPVVVEIEYDATGRGSPLAGAGIIITSASGVRVGGYNTYMSEPPPHAIAPAGVVQFTITDPVLTPGAYRVTASLGTHPTALADKVEDALGFIIEPRDIYATGYLLSPDDGVVALMCDVTVSSSADPGYVGAGSRRGRS